MKVSSLESISLMKVEQGRIKTQVEEEVLGIMYTEPSHLLAPYFLPNSFYSISKDSLQFIPRQKSYFSLPQRILHLLSENLSYQRSGYAFFLKVLYILVVDFPYSKYSLLILYQIDHKRNSSLKYSAQILDTFINFTIYGEKLLKGK